MRPSTPDVSVKQLKRYKSEIVKTITIIYYLLTDRGIQLGPVRLEPGRTATILGDIVDSTVGRKN